MSPASFGPRHRWHAAAYDLIVGFDKKHDAAMRLPLISQAEGQVLEIGFGTGLDLAYYDWSRVESLEATEPDPYMLKRAEKRLRRLPETVRQRVHLHEAPAESLPFEDASFDCIVSMLVLCTVTDPARALAEARRLLRPGGRLLVLEHVRGSGRVAKAQSLVQPAWGWLAAGCHLDRDTERTLREAGFEPEIQDRFKALAVPFFRGVATLPFRQTL